MFKKDSLHHAYFIEGDRAAIIADVEAFLSGELGMNRVGNPDFYFAEHESFGVEESRDLAAQQLMRPVMGERKVFLISLRGITGEAQNALLKVFEEPTPGAHFFVVSPSARILLPTLRSRMVVVTHPSALQGGKNDAARAADDAQAFMTMPAKDRLAFVAPIIEEKDRPRAEAFLQALMIELHTAGKTKAVREILPLLGYLKDRASSLKLILERAALL